MKDFLFELGLEEVPARFMSALVKDFKINFEKTLKDNKLSYNSVNIYATYRRIAVLIYGLAEKQDDICLQQKGPAKEIGIKDGVFQAPAIGFAKKFGLTPEELTFIEENGKSYLFASKTSEGQDSVKILPEIIDSVINKINLPIAMKWGEMQRMFIRPVHWIVALLEDQVIDFELFGIKTDRVSYAHRFLTENKNSSTIASGAPVIINKVTDYMKSLREHFVVVSQEERRTYISQQLAKYLDSNDIDPELLEEVTYLVECPEVLIGSFDRSYLEIPQEVLIECMKKHQKYFPVLVNGQLKEQFLITADNVTDKSRNNIIKGNESVLIARLEDARFFWQEDTKKSLESFLAGLKNVVFQKNLGSIFDKKERIKSLCEYLVEIFDLQAEKQTILRTAELCKADLHTQMVYEFPSLQGIMGQKYALKSGEQPAVALGIFEHYLPRFSGDNLPSELAGTLVSLADKMDTLVCCYVNNLLPTGSQDPWGIRRIIAGIYQIINTKNLKINIDDFLKRATEIIDKKNENEEKLRKMLLQRMKNYFTELKISYDAIEAVLEFGLADLNKTISSAIYIDNYRKSEPQAFKFIVESAVRVKRLSKKLQSSHTVEQGLFEKPVEKEAWDLFLKIQPEVEKVWGQEDFKTIFLLFGQLSAVITRYFEDVMVMHEDNKIRENRLSFLYLVNSLYSLFANFEAIVLA